MIFKVPFGQVQLITPFTAECPMSEETIVTAKVKCFLKKKLICLHNSHTCHLGLILECASHLQNLYWYLISSRPCRIFSCVFYPGMLYYIKLLFTHSLPNECLLIYSSKTYLFMFDPLVGTVSPTLNCSYDTLICLFS